MAGKKKNATDTSADRSAKDRNVSQDPGQRAQGQAGVEREGPHGERLSEEIIDTEVATQAMEGGHSVPKEDVQDAFQKQDQGSRET